MKNNLLLIILLFSLLSFGQQGTVTINWKDGEKLTVTDKVIVEIPQFDGGNMDYRYLTKELFFGLNIPVSGYVDASSLQVINVVYESVTPDKLGVLDVNKIPATIKPSVVASHARDDWYAFLRLSPIINSGSGYKRVKSFSYSFTTGTAGFNFKDTQVVTNSVLSSGEWHRFYVERSGVYKISKSFLQQLGVNVNVDPRRIKIYGNGGRMLPLRNDIPYPDDLAENAITFIGEEDGDFGNSDYILFYAEGVDNWNAESQTHSNLFADRSYYYVTSQGGNGKRITTQIQPTGPVAATVTSFDDYYYHEEDLVSIGRLGRKWHGEQFNVNNSQDFEFSVPDIDLSVPVSVTVNAAAKSLVSTSMAVSANAQSLGAISFSAAQDSDAARDGVGGNNGYTATFTPAGGTITVNLSYSNGGVPGSNAWLDYIILKAKRFLKGNGSQFRFRYNAALGSLGVLEYQLSNASGINEVWDVTDIYNVKKYINEGGQSQFSFRAQSGEVRQYVTVVSSNFYTPLRESQARVANQNIKGTIFNNSQGQFEDIDYIIVTPASLNSEAERLANIHRTRSGLNVKVVDLERIYQEFSSGKQDVAAIRNLIKYVYYNASNDANKIKYVCLFGDASFDFKDRIPNNTNIVPTLHGYDPSGSIPNYNSITTFVSDDFFVLMDPTEGAQLGSDPVGPDIAVGRMLVSSVSQAREMVDKVEQYLNEESYGRWRNEFVLLSDDLDDGGEQFVNKMEGTYNGIVEYKPFINVRKVYTDSYVQESSSGGYRYPQAKEQIIRTVNNGALVVNYLGHGGEDGMAAERIFEKTDAQSLTNQYKYPLFITVTCELTRFDNPYRPTCGEYLYWNSAGGAIGLITTTRSIFVTAAFGFNDVLPAKLFAFNGGDYPSMAEAMRQAKIEFGNNNLRVVSFIGDPALKLAIPRPKVVLTAVNDVPVDQSVGVLEALSFVKMTGRVTDEAGNSLNTYNGELGVTVFDKEIERRTLANDEPDNDSLKFDFDILGEAIFRGNASVTGGQFEFNFVVPRDIRIPVGNGRVSFYSKRNNVLEDQTGYDNSIQVGGINENAEEDITGPTVRLYMNDEAFISGGITNDSPIFLAFLEDEHGINTASGIGHDIIAILDGDETNPYILNDYYETDVDSYTNGSLRYPFSGLEPGLHTLTFKAWDVYNNPVTAELQFVVVGDEEMRLEKVLNYPNPFVNYTEFWFTHNRPYEPLDVQVQIFTVSGKVVKTINQSVTTEGFLCRDIKWDGRDDFGDRIGKGVYIYKLTVRSASTNKKAEKYEKLVLL
ncbi:type IX secretion system sortase PorU [Flavobacterium rakeshii]|uniref:type IX secretion system sortase PorU n=1 Tax=Flavobacterium rakeshii TaxID=1038845 RepID=UPI002E7C50DC|nr:type IX secretion system sortase PorU [Flavobacterium rakeshii]MEE1896720.1 type IX secretion system sortase PorU [Flavobacterium rakeshii]